MPAWRLQDSPLISGILSSSGRNRAHGSGLPLIPGLSCPERGSSPPGKAALIPWGWKHREGGQSEPQETPRLHPAAHPEADKPLQVLGRTSSQDSQPMTPTPLISLLLTTLVGGDERNKNHSLAPSPMRCPHARPRNTGLGFLSAPPALSKMLFISITYVHNMKQGLP